MQSEQIILDFWQQQDRPNVSAEEFWVSDYIDNGYLDSLGFVSFVVYLEETLGISFSQEEIQSPDFRTFRGVASILQKRVEDAKSPAN